MEITDRKVNLKIFSLDKNHKDLRGKKPDDLIMVIVDNHKSRLHAEKIDYTPSKFLKIIDDEFSVWSYCFNEEKENFYWKTFLPKEIGEKQNFQVVEFSYVLILQYKDDYYCIIGGSGMTVIKKYLDNNFGIDVYQHFAKPKQDSLLDISIRSVTGNISQTKFTYSQNQTVFDALSYSEIPAKIKIILRDELLKTIFKKYSLNPNRPLLEIGNYFAFKKRISYNTLKALIVDIDKIRSDKTHYEELTLFKKVKDQKTVEDLDSELLNLVVSDVLSLNSPLGRLANADIIEIVHPSKLEKFFECNRFNIKISRLREDKAINIFDRHLLYPEIINYIFSQCENTLDEYEIKGKIFNTDVKGFYNDEMLTSQKFFFHLTAEIYLGARKYFRIDGVWYFLSDEYLTRLKIEAVETYKDYELKEPILNPWLSGDLEDDYNKSHQKLPGYYILDKTFKENIELCDILKIENDKLYFIHVKDKFDTSMRDLYVQVVLSAKRLWNDISNTTDISFLKNTLDYYNTKKKSRGKKIDTKDIIKKVKKKEVEIIFVMAYNNKAYKTKSGPEKINASQSNIAQYSLVQTSREMRKYSNFKFFMIDISQI